MKSVRLGIIGLGAIGRHHASYVLAGQVPRCELVAVANRSAEPLEAFSHLQRFTSGEDLIQSGAVDAVLIATPHFDHVTLGIKALKAGLHVLLEKPIAAHKADAERLLKAHDAARPGRVFAAMLQLRTEPRYQRIRQLILGGELGEIKRVVWLITDWFRTDAYFKTSSWRATWRGEGGGVLLNQCLHNLDMLFWLLGAPARVRGFCRLGCHHEIEVEDEVNAYWEYPNGASGVLVTSTGEAPGSNRLEIAGTRGLLVLEKNRLHFTRNEVPMDQFSRQAESGFARPPVWEADLPFTDAPATHATITQNFVEAILDGAPLIAPGKEGLQSVEFANAILYSSLRDTTVTLPLNARAYERELKKLIAGSKLRKPSIRRRADDMAASFRR